MNWTGTEKKLAVLNVAFGLGLTVAALKAFAWVDQTQYQRGIDLRNNIIVYRGLTSDYRRHHGRHHRR